MKKRAFLIIALFLILIPFISAPFGYDNPTLPKLKEELFDGKPSGFYMPNNKSVFGNFSFNGGWQGGGFSIIDGDIYAQTGYFYNLTSLNVTKQNLTIIENFIVEGNISADWFIGDGSQLTDLTHSLQDAYDDGSIIQISGGAGGRMTINVTSGLGNQFRILSDNTRIFSVDPSSSPPLESASWMPIADNTYDLGRESLPRRWRNLYLSGNVSLSDDTYLFFDTAKDNSLRYSSDHGGLIIDGYLAHEGRFYIFSNTGADAGGNWEPSMDFHPDGHLLISAVVGDLNDKYVKIHALDGLKLRTTGAKDAILSAGLISGTDKLFQFPNQGGTFALTSDLDSYVPYTGAVSNVDLGSYNLTASYFLGNSSIWSKAGTNIFPTNIGNYVGIGTSSPSELLEVEGGNVFLDGGRLIITRATANNMATFTSNDDLASITIADDDTTVYVAAQDSYMSLGFTAGLDADNLNIKSTGEVGIGTSSPDMRLEIAEAQSGGTSRPTLRITDTKTDYGDDGGNIGILTGGLEFYNDETSGNFPTVATAIYSVIEGSTAVQYGLAFYTNNNLATPTEKMRINNIGNVGIGTSSPSGKLSVNTSSDVVVSFESSDAISRIGISDSASTDWFNRGIQADGNEISLVTTGARRLIISAAGHVNVVNAISSGTATITSSADNISVSGINVLFVNPAGTVVIGGFTGGVNGQVLFISALSNGQDITLEHNEGVSDQNVFVHTGGDETLSSEYGGWTLTCNGTNWYDTEHSKHV